ncbi:hypothetical protein RhiTH_001073 [Rhizoctonia solani]
MLSDSDSEHVAKRARRATPTFDFDTDSETHPDLSTRSDSEPDPYTTSELNTDDEPDPTAEPSATHVETFFSKYRSFTFNTTQPIMAEFYRLCAFTLVDREKARQGFRDALTRDFNEMYGVDEDDLGSWQRLCRAVVAKVPDDIEECRKFESEAELSSYTKTMGKYFPNDSEHAGSLLKFLLRFIAHPTNVKSGDNIERTR